LPGRPPDISGTWKGVLTSDYIDPETKEKIPPIKVFMAIEQTSSDVLMRQISAESQSNSLSTDLSKSAGVWKLNFNYLNEPRTPFQGRSQIHMGSGVLYVHGNSPTSINGQYWTSRNSRGEIDFEKRSKIVHTRFEDAEKDEALVS
jgi:hypothetical protein